MKTIHNLYKVIRRLIFTQLSDIDQAKLKSINILCGEVRKYKGNGAHQTGQSVRFTPGGVKIVKALKKGLKEDETLLQKKKKMAKLSIGFCVYVFIASIALLTIVNGK